MVLLKFSDQPLSNIEVFAFQRSEPLGVLVIERCTVELDLEEDAPNSFVLGKQFALLEHCTFSFQFLPPPPTPQPPSLSPSSWVDCWHYVIDGMLIPDQLIACFCLLFTSCFPPSFSIVWLFDWLIDDHLCSAILRSLEQTHCARMWCYMSD